MARQHSGELINRLFRPAIVNAGQQLDNSGGAAKFGNQTQKALDKKRLFLTVQAKLCGPNGKVCYIKAVSPYYGFSATSLDCNAWWVYWFSLFLKVPYTF